MRRKGRAPGGLRRAELTPPGRSSGGSPRAGRPPEVHDRGEASRRGRAELVPLLLCPGGGVPRGCGQKPARGAPGAASAQPPGIPATARGKHRHPEGLGALEAEAAPSAARRGPPSFPASRPLRGVALLACTRGGFRNPKAGGKRGGKPRY